MKVSTKYSLTIWTDKAITWRPQVKVALDDHGGHCRDHVERCLLWVHEKAKEGVDIYGVTTRFNACLRKRTN